MSFMPLHDRVLVRRIEAEAKTASGLLIPDSAQEKPQKGEIVAVGEGARSKGGALIAMSVKAGDRIHFGKWSGSEIRMDGEDLIVMHESDILGVLDVQTPETGFFTEFEQMTLEALAAETAVPAQASTYHRARLPAYVSRTFSSAPRSPSALSA